MRMIISSSRRTLTRSREIRFTGRSLFVARTLRPNTPAVVNGKRHDVSFERVRRERRGDDLSSAVARTGIFERGVRITEIDKRAHADRVNVLVEILVDVCTTTRRRT